MDACMAKKERTAPWDRRRDKSGGYAHTRRWEKSLERKGLEDRSVPVASLQLGDGKRDYQGKGALTIFRDVIMRMRRVRRPRLSARTAINEGLD